MLAFAHVSVYFRNMVNLETIREIANRLAPEIVALRRTFHQYPELSWKERKTSERIREALLADGLEMEREVCPPGLVAEIRGTDGGKTVAVRADMDALPMHDAKEVPYASKVPGVMHACGHDCHMAIAIGVAKTLRRLEATWPGKVRFIFQPSEETTPSGAEEMVKAGVMEGVDEIFAFHVAPEIPAGKVGVREGVLTAYCTEFNLSVFGRSGHAARPHQSVDTVFLSSRVLSALYEIVPSRTEPFIPAVLSVGKVVGGTKANVIPERVDIAGSVRTIDEFTRNEILSAMEDRVAAITRMYGGSYQLEFPPPIPSVVNDPTLSRAVRRLAVELLSESGVHEIEKVSMGGEDFSWYLTKAPGMLIRLGARTEGQAVRYLHTHDFDVDERALPVGVALMAAIVLTRLLESTT